MAAAEAPERIVCATDFSDNAAAALDAAVALARPWKARILLVHVVSPSRRPGERKPASPAPLDQAVRTDLFETLQRSGSAAVSAGIETETVLLQGEPAEEIVREAQRAGARLIVMGRHSRGTPDHWFLGSVTERVLRHAPCPVVVAKPPPRAPGRSPRRVICALDLSETSEATLAQAAALTCRLGADLLVLHVVSEHVAGAWAPGLCGGVPPAQDPRVGLDGLVAAAGPASDLVDQRVVTGDPQEQIVAAARDTGTDLIVVGSHAGRLLDHQFVGSTTLHLVRKAECDVLVVPAHVSREAGVSSGARSAEAAEMPRRGSLGCV